jgi:hypothetical protein
MSFTPLNWLQLIVFEAVLLGWHIYGFVLTKNGFNLLGLLICAALLVLAVSELKDKIAELER